QWLAAQANRHGSKPRQNCRVRLLLEVIRVTLRGYSAYKSIVFLSVRRWPTVQYLDSQGHDASPSVARKQRSFLRSARHLFGLADRNVAMAFGHGCPTRATVGRS